ncbi:hypothetical protein MA16_Dca006799 [Dendrobium catenatum]|uniref:Uncharacterized protein n=1 Tax=Dendrobium catenatum TaxID=906689 RepID=A0A2I0W963_9ASPA|nr:hypothetical protein MA16_Dca006799 [Dendrobium catenatum]
MGFPPGLCQLEQGGEGASGFCELGGELESSVLAISRSVEVGEVVRVSGVFDFANWRGRGFTRTAEEMGEISLSVQVSGVFELQA